MPAVPARIQPAPELIAEAVQRLSDARRPVILAGGGATRAQHELRALAERLDAPVVMTVNGRGLLAPDHPLTVPASPSLESVRELMAASDAILAVGTELGPTDYDMYERGMPDLPGPLLRLDIDPVQMTQPRVADVPLTGDAGGTLAALLEGLPEGTGQGHDGASRAERTREAARASLDSPMQRGIEFLETVRDTLPEAILVGDSTHPIYAGNLYFAAARVSSWFNSATGYGTLGYALPASLGAALAAPDRPIVCLVGDGGLHYTLGEIASIRDQDRPVIVLLWNNAGFGEIRLAMEAEQVTPIGVNLFAPDFEALAQAYGYAFEAPQAQADLPELLTAAAKRRAPTLVRLDEARMLAED